MADHNLYKTLPEEEPLFNIGAVSRMTDIAETTLRVWERRYDFPRSTRTAGGHRLYSHQEIMRLQWIKAQLDEGMQISQSIRALQQMEQQEAFRYAEPAGQSIHQGHEATGTDHLGLFRQNLFESLITHEMDEASQILTEIFVLFPLELVLTDIVGPVLVEIGMAWGSGQIDVATEHLASNHLRLHMTLWLRTTPPPYDVDPVILACAPGELHEGSLLMLAIMLRRLRWPILYLGQNMPIANLAKFIDQFTKPIIVLAASSEETALAMMQWEKILSPKKANKDFILGYGGHAFNAQPDLIEKVPGLFLGHTLLEGLDTLDQILHQLNPRLGQ